MGRVSRYRLGFDPWGLGLFLLMRSTPRPAGGGRLPSVRPKKLYQ